MGFPGVNLSLVAPGFEMVAYLKNSGSTLVFRDAYPGELSTQKQG